MPRKNRPPKNRFCRRSKLTEEEFATLVRYYFHEVLYGDSRNNYCFYFKRWSKTNKEVRDFYKEFRIKYPEPNKSDFLHESTLFPSELYVEDRVFKEKPEREDGRNEFITRQRISNIFNKISQYIWDNYVITQHPSFQEEDIFDPLLDLIYGNESKPHPYKLPYIALHHVGICLTKGKLSSSLMFHLLSQRSKVVRGFKKDKFYLEFSRVLFICIVIRHKKIKYTSIYSLNEDKKLKEILTASTAFLLNFLEKKPL